MKILRYLLLKACLLYPIIVWCAVDDTISSVTEEGVKVWYTITTEGTTNGRYGKVCVGYATANSYILSIDKKTEGRITIPSMISYRNINYDVVSIAAHAFDGCSSISSVVIPETVTTINDYAFKGCSSLELIELPNSVKSIGSYCFSGCSSLEHALLSNQISTIEKGTFEECTNLTSINLSNISTIRDDCFNGCNSLANVSFSELFSVGKRCFFNCISLTEVTFKTRDDGIFMTTNFGENMFSGCTSLKSVYYYGSNPQNGPQSHLKVFENIHPDATLYVSYGMDKAFEESGRWSMFAQIRIIPPNIGDTFVADLAQVATVRLKVSDLNPMSVVIDSVLYISEKNIELPSTLIDYKDILFQIKGIESFAFKSLDLNSISISEGYTEIKKNAFAECSNLLYVTLPQSLKTLNSAFYGCYQLQSIIMQNRKLTNNDVAAFCFEGIPNSAILYVPAGTKERYEAIDAFSCFSEIIETSPISSGDVFSSYGARVNLPISLRNKETIAGIQFRLTLPIGVTIINDSGSFLTSLTERTDGMIIDCRKDPDADNTYSIVMLSFNGFPIKGTEGPLMKVKLDVNPDLPVGKYEIMLQDVYMTTATFETLSPASSTSELTIKDFMLGDVNGDGNITAQDSSLVLQLVAKKVTSETEGVTYGAADVNGDGQVTAQDASLILQYVAKKITW